MKKILGRTIMVVGLIVSCLATVFNSSLVLIANAAGKTVEGFKATDYDEKKGSDAKVMYNGIKKYDSKYTGIYREVDNVTNSNFYSKSRTIKYWSSHGTDSGTLFSDTNLNIYIDIFNDKSSFSWSGSNLEFVFLAACNQLNKEGKNPVKKYAKAMRGNKAVRVICGYHSKATSAADVLVAKKFLEYAKTGESVKSSWMKANEYYANKGYSNCNTYAVLTHSGNVQYSRFPGFSSTTYPRPDASSKKIIRFRRGVESGETIIKAARIRNNKITKQSIPNYRLKAKPVKFIAKKQCRDMVFNDENRISTDVGEIGEKQINYSRKKLYQLASKYYNKNLKSNSKQFELEQKEMKVAPILASDACEEDGEETTIGYSVVFPNTYEGITIEGDGFNAIIDEGGVKYTSAAWHDFEKEKVEENVISLEDAMEIVQKTKMDNNNLVRTMSLNKNIKNNISNVNIVFLYNEETGYYESNYQFTLETGDSVKVNCYNGDINKE